MSDLPYTPEQLLIGWIAFIVVLLIIVIYLTRPTSKHPYERQLSILTPAEQDFYKELSSVIKGQALIMAKVRIADLISVRKSVRQKHFWFHFSKISQKHIDFVLLDPQTFNTICTIELDDRSHTKLNRKKRDKFVNQVMATTDIPLYRFKVRRRYNQEDILQTLKPSLEDGSKFVGRTV